MAGDWIKMRVSLLTHPKVIAMADHLAWSDAFRGWATPGFKGDVLSVITRDVTRYVTVAGLLQVWGAANEHTTDGLFLGLTVFALDDMAGIPGFGAAMAVVGWAINDQASGGLRLPNFNEYNVAATSRSSNAERQKRFRERQKANANSSVIDNVTRDVTNNTRSRERKDTAGQKKPPVVELTAPTSAHRTLAAELGINCDAEWAAFNDRIAAKGKPWFTDKPAAFSGWLRQERKYAERDGRLKPAKAERKLAL